MDEGEVTMTTEEEGGKQEGGRVRKKHQRENRYSKGTGWRKRRAQRQNEIRQGTTEGHILVLQSQ